MTTTTLEDADLHGFIRVLCALFGVPQRDDAAAHAVTQGLVTQLIQENRQMSATTQAKLAEISAKEDAEAVQIAALSTRITVRDDLLHSIQDALDTATATIAEDQTQLQALRDQLAAMPTDTTEAEALIDSIMAKQDSNVAALSAIGTVPADPAPAAQPSADPAAAAADSGTLTA